MNGNSDNSDLATRLTKTLAADPKKSGALAILAVLLLVIGGRQFLGSGHPEPAGASMTPTPQSKIAGGRSGKSAQGAFSSQRASGVSPAMLKWSTAPLPPLSRNLFAVRIEYFPFDGSRTVQSGPADEGFWSRLEKSMALQADQRDKQENLRANFKTLAAKLRLESTMPGAQPRAMVNGELVGEGSVVAGFRVIKIDARRITIEREGIQLEIQMK
jgi:hypothetical protein